MKSINRLIQSAAELTEHGRSQGEIADELNVSRETATWLVTQSQREAATPSTADRPTDVHVDWSAIGRDGRRLSHLGAIMADLLATEGADADVTIGIGTSGAPLATVISQELDTDVGVYMPSKQQWNEDERGAETGLFSQNFATVADGDCYIVDDNIDTGQTMTETIEQIRDHGGAPRAGVVLTDKLGEDEIDGVPIHSLVEMVQMGDE